jgi:hypothetical protein
VKLEIEEDAVATVGERPYNVGPFEGEQPLADFESADHAAELAGELERARAALDVERD